MGKPTKKFTKKLRKWWKKYGIWVVVIYLIMPVDLIIDALPIVGILDDLALVLINHFVSRRK